MNDSPSSDLDRILSSAARLGVEVDREEALQWLAAIAAAGGDEPVQVDEAAGVFGHRVTMLDFSPDDLAHFREVGRLVKIPDSEGVETALALSGSAAQSKIQTYPGDCDYFQRVNIRAPGRDQACSRLARLMRDKILATLSGETFRFIEAKFGSYPEDLEHRGKRHATGSPIAWSREDVVAGAFVGRRPGGGDVVVAWDDVALDPGWCKLDWVIADPVRGELANASNMLDVTWEAPDGSIVPLDGYLDPYFQEVYLEAESIPVFTKLAEHVSPDALGDYVEQLEGEVRKYVAKDPRNYGKAAKRMYNVFRLSGRYEAAAYVRELFDEPAALLYQVHALIRTVDEAADPGSPISGATIVEQLDDLILAVVRTLEGTEEEAIVSELLALRDGITGGSTADLQSARVEAARQRVINLVNTFFRERLVAMPEIAEYLVSVTEA
jgi:hypothetical protein